ncbi:hypothetical protein AB7G19_13845 [Bradyrhizobium sp. 215_C5_N1_1]|uniref:hypothetical protein n=1 Tax=unclassified Bradyrhizobium TaxID=2631580 RepID=UPI003F89C65D
MKLCTTSPHQTNALARTGLILFIRPTVIKDGVDAHVIAEEMRSKMNSRLVGTSNPVVTVSPPKAARCGRDGSRRARRGRPSARAQPRAAAGGVRKSS